MRLRNLYTIISSKDGQLNILIESHRFDLGLLSRKFSKIRELFIQLKHSVALFGQHNAAEVYIVDLCESNKIIIHPKQRGVLFPNCRRIGTNISFTANELNQLFGNALKVFVAINPGERANADYVVNGIMADHEEYNDDLQINLYTDHSHKLLLESDIISADKKYFNREDYLDDEGRIGIYSIMDRFSDTRNETVKLAVGLLSININILP